MFKRSEYQEGFTLIELMITVAIIGILAAVAYPAYTSQIAKGKRAECRSGLLQSMQQQERYASQYNAYAAFTEAASAAKTRSFSGETQAQSSCLMAAVTCTAPGSTDIKACVEIRARPVRADSAINYLYLDSDERKGCSVSGTRTDTNKTCWP